MSHSSVKYYSPFDNNLINKQYPPLMDAEASYSMENKVKLSKNVRDEEPGRDGYPQPTHESYVREEHACDNCISKRDNVLVAERYLRPPNRSAGRGLTNMEADNKLRYSTPGRLIFPFSVSDIDMGYQQGFDTRLRNYHNSNFIVQSWPQGGYPTRLKDKYYTQQ